MTGVSWTKKLMMNNAPYSEMLKILRCHMLIQTFSLAFFLTLTHNMEGLKKWPSRGIKYTNTLVLTLTTPHQSNYYSTRSITLEMWSMTSQNTLRVNQKHLPNTTFLILWKMQPNHPEPTQTFFVNFWRIFCTWKIDHIQTYRICTRVIEPDTDYFKNLSMVMKYIQGTISLSLILSIDKSGSIKWYADASFAAHK